MTRKQRKRGRPARPMPPPIPATPEDLARAILQGPPKKDWRYLAEYERQRAERAEGGRNEAGTTCGAARAP